MNDEEEERDALEADDERRLRASVGEGHKNDRLEDCVCHLNREEEVIGYGTVCHPALAVLEQLAVPVQEGAGLRDLLFALRVGHVPHPLPLEEPCQYKGTRATVALLTISR